MGAETFSDAVRELEAKYGIAAILEALAAIAVEQGTGDLGEELEVLASEVRMNMYG